MKKFIIFGLLTLLSVSHAQAGLFEYYLGGTTPTNATSTADAVETIEQYQAPQTSNYNSSYPYNSYDNRYSVNYDSCRNWTLGQVRPSCEYYTTYSTNSGNFYEKQHLINMLEDELDEIEDEQDYIADTIRDIKVDIRNAKRYATSYYKNLRKRLEAELDFFEDKKDELEDREDDIKDEIRKVRNSSSSSRSYYYDYYGVYDSYYDNRYDYDRYYYSRGYYKYDYDSGRYIPHWVNPELEAVKDGHIYIR